MQWPWHDGIDCLRCVSAWSRFLIPCSIIITDHFIVKKNSLTITSLIKNIWKRLYFKSLEAWVSPFCTIRTGRTGDASFLLAILWKQPSHFQRLFHHHLLSWIAQVVETERGSCALVSSATSADEHTILFWRPRQKSLGNHASHDLHEVHNEVPFFFLYSTLSMAYYWQYGCSINNDKTTAWQ